MRVCYFSRGTSLHSNRSNELPYNTHVTHPFPYRAEPDTSLFGGGPYGSFVHQQIAHFRHSSLVQAPSVSPDMEHGINDMVGGHSRDAMDSRAK